jgi:hypothetical protein
MLKTPTPFRFDGHGINDAEGQRVCKVSSCEPYVYPDGRPNRNEEFDELSKMFALAPEYRTFINEVASLFMEEVDYDRDINGADAVDALVPLIKKARRLVEKVYA